MPALVLFLPWLIGIAIAALTLFLILPWWARRTPNDIDDVIVGVVQRPAFIILVFLALQKLTAASTLADPWRTVVLRGCHLVLIAAITWGIWQLVRSTILYYGHELAKRSESNFDDVLVPVLDVLAPMIIIVTGAVLMLRLLGVDISTVVLTAGGAALIVGLALRDTLGNILGGIWLLIDTPFRFGDLVVWDNVVCQIKRIGLRVTTLYNTEDHSDIFVPNTSLAANKLTNLTRPSPDLRMPIDVVLANPALLEEAKSVLYYLADANPYILGDLPKKLVAMKHALAEADPRSELARELKWGLSALRREYAVDRLLAKMDLVLLRLLETIRQMEKGGLSRTELATLNQQVDALDASDEPLKAAVRRWAAARTRDPHLRAYPADREMLLKDAEKRILTYEQRLAHLRQHLKRPTLYEAQRLDDVVSAFRAWLPVGFKHVTPAWKHPLIAITQTVPAFVALRLFIYVDDIQLEGFVRRLRVTNHLKEQAMEQLQKLCAAKS